MKLELAASGLSEEEILEKAKLLMRAFGKEEAGSTAEFMLMSKQTNAALVKSGLPPKDFTLVSNPPHQCASNMRRLFCFDFFRVQTFQLIKLSVKLLDLNKYLGLVSRRQIDLCRRVNRSQPPTHVP